MTYRLLTVYMHDLPAMTGVCVYIYIYKHDIIVGLS